ncbi:MAG TPA: TIGR00725 family protein [Solirubrobacteraceae bacterium]|jgi:hypothetical protein
MAHGADSLHIGVIGSSVANAEQISNARAVGLGLAQAGALVVCGGLGGVMEAACEGVREGGGVSVGILPDADRSRANRYVDVAIPTGMGELRNGLIVRAADALIAIGGGWGTLSEIAFAMRTDRGLVALGSWDLKDIGEARIERVSDPAQAVARALALASERADQLRLG